ncbi:hypothetical protein CRENBAI_000516 [Crenichthys baileyi]|uniref:Uncharacterized protein n=1 Tax=Crenichthys baileyi TaxID=28760 RepID=A0AAV9S654_9TELE
MDCLHSLLLFPPVLSWRAPRKKTPIPGFCFRGVLWGDLLTFLFPVPEDCEDAPSLHAVPRRPPPPETPTASPKVSPAVFALIARVSSGFPAPTSELHRGFFSGSAAAPGDHWLLRQPLLSSYVARPADLPLSMEEAGDSWQLQEARGEKGFFLILGFTTSRPSNKGPWEKLPLQWGGPPPLLRSPLH